MFLCTLPNTLLAVLMFVTEFMLIILIYGWCYIAAVMIIKKKISHAYLNTYAVVMQTYFYVQMCEHTM